MCLFYFKAEHVYATVRTVFIGYSYHCHSGQGHVLFFCTLRGIILNHSDQLSTQPKPRGTNVGKKVIGCFIMMSQMQDGSLA